MSLWSLLNWMIDLLLEWFIIFNFDVFWKFYVGIGLWYFWRFVLESVFFKFYGEKWVVFVVENWWYKFNCIFIG